MRHLIRGSVLALLLATGAGAQEEPDPSDAWIEVPVYSEYIVLSVQSDSLELGRPTSAHLDVHAPPDVGIVVESIRSTAQDVQIAFLDPPPIEVPPGSSRAVRLVITPDPPEFFEAFIGKVDASRVGTATHKLIISLKAGGKPADRTAELTVHAGLSGPAVRAILGWGFLGILIGFGIKRLGLWQARLVTGARPDPPVAVDAPQPADDPREAADRRARQSLAVDLMITAMLGSMAILLTHVQEPDHFTSLLAAFVMGLALGGLTDDQLRQRVFAGQGA